MEAISEKMRHEGEDKSGKKNTVELNLGKNGGIFILLGGALVSVLLSSVFKKRKKSGGDEDENHRGRLKSTAAEEVVMAEDDNVADNNEDHEVRKGLSFIVCEEHIRAKDVEGDFDVHKEMNNKAKDENVLKIHTGKEQNSPKNDNNSHQEIISNNSSAPSSATSSEQEYSSRAFDNHALFEQESPSKKSEEGTLHYEDFRCTNLEGTTKTTLENVAEIADVLPHKPEEMNCVEKNCSPKIEMDLCDEVIEKLVVDMKNDTNDDRKKTTSDQTITSGITNLKDDDDDDDDDGDDDGDDNSQEIEENYGELEISSDESNGDYDDISEETKENSEKSGILSSDESADDDYESIWPEQDCSKGIKGRNAEQIEDDETLNEKSNIDSKTINNTKQQTRNCRGELKMKRIQDSTRKSTDVDNLVTLFSFRSRRRVVTGTIAALLIAYSCLWYLESPLLKPSLVVIAVMFLICLRS